MALAEMQRLRLLQLQFAFQYFLWLSWFHFFDGEGAIHLFSFHSQIFKSGLLFLPFIASSSSSLATLGSCLWVIAWLIESLVHWLMGPSLLCKWQTGPIVEENVAQLNQGLSNWRRLLAAAASDTSQKRHHMCFFYALASRCWGCHSN